MDTLFALERIDHKEFRSQSGLAAIVGTISHTDVHSLDRVTCGQLISASQALWIHDRLVVIVVFERSFKREALDLICTFMRYIPMRCTPVRYTLMRYMPMRCTPMTCTPMRCTFMRYTPMRCTSLRYTPMRYTP